MITEEVINRTINSPKLSEFPVLLIIKVIQEIAIAEEELCKYYQNE